MELDSIDLKILSILQKAGRTRRNDLAATIGLSLPAASERLRKLEESGYITGYFSKLDHIKLGLNITAFIVVNVDSSKHFSTFIEQVSMVDEILECHAITGEGTHLLKIRTENAQTLEKLLSKIQSWNIVTKTTTSIVLSTSKESFKIKLLQNK